MSSSKPKHTIRFRQISNVDDPAREGFIRTFQHAFGDIPYLEQTPDQDCNDIWKMHIDHCLWVAECENCKNHVVGFSCAHSLSSEHHKDIQAFLASFEGTDKALPFDWRQAVYMSEVAVLASHRGYGIGTNLIQLRRRWAHDAGIPHYIMRTASEGSHSERIYTSERIGAQRAKFLQPVEGQAGEIDSASTHRLYLYGSTNFTGLPPRVTW